MHPLLTSSRNFLLAIFTWLLITGSLILLLKPISSGSWQDISILAGPPLFLLFFILLSNYFISKSVKISKDNFYLPLAKHFLSAILFNIIWLQLTMLYSESLVFFSTSDHWRQLFKHILPVLIGIGFLFYLIFTLLHYLYIEGERLHQLQQETLKNKLTATKAELNTLKMSIHPHFLFNSFTALSTLTQSDPQKAGDVSMQLADFLRQSLTYIEKEWTPLHEELEHITSYLSIEQVRLGNRLNLDFKIDPDTKEYFLPPSTLLPLIENAIKHGIEQMLEKSTLLLQIQKVNNMLFLLVQNPVNPDAKARPGNGYGLKSLKKRLNAAFAQQIEFYEQKGEDFYSLSFRLPLIESRPVNR